MTYFLLIFCCYLGGRAEKNYPRDIEIIYANGSKSEDPMVLPEPRHSHCMVEYSGIIILMGGGYENHYDLLIADAICKILTIKTH